jgi:hypothetical protein
MHRRVEDLFACWKGLSGSPHSAAVWEMIPSCLMWYFWMERNDRSFEDCERTMLELKSFFFNTLYYWAATLDYPILLGFHNFLTFFSLSSNVFLLYTSCIPGLHLLCFLMIFRLLIKKLLLLCQRMILLLLPKKQ